MSAAVSKRHSPLLNRLWWPFLASAILATATVLRIYELALKPLHNDEGVNGFFLLELFRHGIYHYNAANYHGPTLYYCGLITCSLNNFLFGGEGPSTIAIRMVPVLFGIGVTALLLSLRKSLGGIGSLGAAALVAVSPGMVYISRDFIHEMLLVFFTLWLVVCGRHFWTSRNAKYLMLGSIAAALMFCTKETAVISAGALILAAGIVFLWIPPSRKVSLRSWGGWREVSALALAAGALFVLSAFLLFSSFLGNYPQGIHDAFATFRYWVRTGITAQSAPWYTYLVWLFKEEASILLLGVLGAVLALAQHRHRLALFAAIWALILLVIYSSLPYKTPWIMLNIILPMCVSAGYLLQQLWDTTTRSRRLSARAAVVVLMSGTLFFSFYQTLRLNFFHYDDDRYPYAYVQTSRGFLDLVSKVNEVAQSTGSSIVTSAAVFSPDYWPLPWYLRDYRNVSYYGAVKPTDATIVIGSKWQEPLLTLSLAGRYRLVGSYPLRPGVDLVLFVANHKTH